MNLKDVIQKPALHDYQKYIRELVKGAESLHQMVRRNGAWIDIDRYTGFESLQVVGRQLFQDVSTAPKLFWHHRALPQYRKIVESQQHTYGEQWMPSVCDLTPAVQLPRVSDIEHLVVEGHEIPWTRDVLRIQDRSGKTVLAQTMGFSTRVIKVDSYADLCGGPIMVQYVSDFMDKHELRWRPKVFPPYLARYYALMQGSK